MAVVAQYSVSEPHMVAMVVGEEYAAYRGAVYAVGRELSRHIVVVDPGINQQPARRRAYICAVAAAATAKRYEAQPLVAVRHLVEWRQHVFVTTYRQIEKPRLVAPVGLLA